MKKEKKERIIEFLNAFQHAHGGKHTRKNGKTHITIPAAKCNHSLVQLALDLHHGLTDLGIKTHKTPKYDKKTKRYNLSGHFSVFAHIEHHTGNVSYICEFS